MNHEHIINHVLGTAASRFRFEYLKKVVSQNLNYHVTSCMLLKFFLSGDNYDRVTKKKGPNFPSYRNFVK